MLCLQPHLAGSSASLGSYFCVFNNVFDVARLLWCLSAPSWTIDFLEESAFDRVSSRSARRSRCRATDGLNNIMHMIPYFMLRVSSCTAFRMADRNTRSLKRVLNKNTCACIRRADFAILSKVERAYARNRLARVTPARSLWRALAGCVQRLQQRQSLFAHTDATVATCT